MSATAPDVFTTHRLAELLRMRGFIDREIQAERQAIAASGATHLIEAAAGLYGTTTAAIQSRSNFRDVTNARMVACWLLRQVGKSYPEIGRAVCRDHTTAMHACRAVERDPARLALARQLLAQEVAA